MNRLTAYGCEIAIYCVECGTEIELQFPDEPLGTRLNMDIHQLLGRILDARDKHREADACGTGEVTR